MNQQERIEQIARLRKQVFDNERNQPLQRKALVRYLKMELDDAKEMSREELHGDTGVLLAHGITGMLALQEWVTDDPEIYKIFIHIAPLELEPEENGYGWQRVEDEWQNVFTLAERLK